MSREELDRLVAVAALEKSIIDHLTSEHKKTRDLLRAELGEGDRKSTPQGKAWVSDPVTKPAVVDEQALLEWVEANLPDELVTTRMVPPGLKAQLLRDGGFHDGYALHPVPGLGEKTATPSLTVKPSEKVREATPALVAMLTQPVLELE